MRSALLPPLSLLASTWPLSPSKSTLILLFSPVKARLKFPRLATLNARTSARSLPESLSVYLRTPLRLPKSRAEPVDPPGSELNVAQADNNVLDSSCSIISHQPQYPQPTDL